MARYTGPRTKKSRRARQLLDENKKKYFDRRPYPPGEAGRARIRESDYLVQLREKQKLRHVYGVLERQFRKYYLAAARQKGITGENLLRLLETRLDNVVYRAGFARTRQQARQLVNHGHFRVNGKKVDIPSYQVRSGDEVSLRQRSNDLLVVQHAVDTMEFMIPEWLSVNHDERTVVVSDLPSRAQIDVPVNEQLIVELYSK